MKKLIISICFLISINIQAQKCNGIILNKQGYTECYVDSLGHSQWVSWNLSLSDIGTVDRQNDFRPDNTLPISFYHVHPSDYMNSGFDKGHLCDSGDRTKTIELNEETFYMSNMIPQSPNNNRITWKDLEMYCRELVKEGNELKIIAGAYGTGGEGSKGFKIKLNNKINVPSNTWKIIKYTKNSKVSIIFVDMPNNQSLLKDWHKYIITQQELENNTGLSFNDFLK